MKKKIIAIIVCMLVIGTASSLVAGTATLRKGDVAGDIVDRKEVQPPRVVDFGQRDSLFFQRPFTPTEGWIFHNSTYDPSYPVDYTCYDNFWDLTGPICDIHWWGLCIDWVNMVNCDLQGLTFEIIFYSDDPHNTTDMPPTDVVCTYSNVVPTYTYYDNYGGWDCYYFSFDLVPCCDLRDGWVSIQSTSHPTNCWFFWSGSPPSEGDGFAYQEGGDPVVNDLALVLTGEPGEEWPDHKMHFPQLPDEIGWDVNATAPKILADDWQCSEQGWVTDIHFWGSWKNIDGMPNTDDVFTPMPWFQLSIHSNLPVGHPQNPFDYSIPGELLWFWEGEIGGIPFDPPSFESWYDPNTDSSICNDHMAYWRYDFFVPQDSAFYQYKDSIYWLDVSALYIQPPYQWGWKTSRDHFMDDAVYMDPGGPWIEMYEPPRCNWFDVYFDGTGTPEDWGSTNYYGAGWYEYEYWWNMWFYDNPFNPYKPKEIFIERLWVAVYGPQAYAEFAINWSTPEWDELEMGRPPLPSDGNEELYIGREIVGPLPLETLLDFNFTIPYNPEWISIDFRAWDVVINGWVYHECVPTSMDMAFVITGVPDTSVICGDVNNDGIVNVGDIVYLVSYLYRGGPAPIPMECVGDVNNDDVVNVGDVVYLVSYLYRSGPAPDPNCCNPPWKE
ncbi:MAG: hypothetical protein WBF13_00335 [Candidatus Zixiibacteriota bacterium]